MATIDYGAIRDDLYRKGAGKEELKARASLPTKAELIAAFQAIENRFEAARPTLKTDLDTALGFTTTGPLARKIMIAWLRWKIRSLETE